MNKGVDKVRKSIEERRKMKQITKNRRHTKHVYPPFPMEEEKHGYFPDYTHNDSFGKNRKYPQLTHFVVKGFLALFLFAGTAFVIKTNGDLFSFPKKWTRHAMTEEFPFARVHKWYQESFGAPMGLSPTSTVPSGQEALALPVNGTVTESFHSNGTGIMITPEEDTDVSALRNGIVIFAGKNKNTGNTVTIQHADGSESTYGHLSDLNVHVYQFIATGQQIGKFKPTASNETIYFAIEKDSRYIDPVQVIKVDESS